MKNHRLSYTPSRPSRPLRLGMALALALGLAPGFPTGDPPATPPGIPALLPAELHAQEGPASGREAAGHRGYYRFPTLHGDRVVFTAEGDLWSVGLEGGLARRLTTHHGEETHPALSPDGRTIAFSAAYEGPTELYTMPASGGLPARRTWEGEEAEVVGWTPDGRILYTTRKHSTLPNHQLVALDPASGEWELLPLHRAAEGTVLPAGASGAPPGTLVFTRFYEQGSHTKRYTGGTAQDLWRLDPGSTEAVPLTPDHPGTSRAPMAWEGRIYFATDRDGTMNLWSMTPGGEDLRQHTRHRGWDVKDPALAAGRIVYQLGADLRLYDIAGGEDRRLDIRLASDLDQRREKWVEDPWEYLDAVRLSPDGKRVALTARGEVFVAPVGDGRFIRITRGPGVRYRAARFDPDGESLLVLSDESGEVEWWRLPADGVGEAVRLTGNGRTLRLHGEPSPDGRWLVSYDHDQEIWLHDLETGEAEQIDFSARWGFDGPDWAPDSRWFAYAKPADNSFWRIHLHHVEDGRHAVITSDRYDSDDMVFGPDGEWLWLLSERDFHSVVGSPWGSRQPEPHFDRQTRIYALALRDGLRFPFAPGDELHPGRGDAGGNGGPGEGDGADGAAAGGEARGGDGDGSVPPPVRIDLPGLERRLHRAPQPPGNYSALSTNGTRLFFLELERGREPARRLMALEIGNDEADAVPLLEDVDGYQLSRDGTRLLVRREEEIYVIPADAGPDPDLEETRVDLSGWRFPIDPAREWRQLFLDSWRLQRDYFYDPEMHGVDWEAMRRKYLPLVDRVTTRAELADLQGQMAGELSALHTFVYGGDRREGEVRVEPASLGARLRRDEAAGGYRVTHVYRSDPDLPEELSPLARPGVDVREGDVVTAVDGVELLSVAHPGVLLRDRAGRQVRLSVRTGPPGPGSPPEGTHREVIVTPVTPAEERDLRYDEWEYTRRLAVDSLSGGEIGYVHLRAMGRDDMADWYRDFYPVFDRAGLVIDVRHNRGGNIDPWILSRLLRKAWFYWQPRVGDPYWNMQYAFRGHAVVLVNERTASDGEAFAEGFRRLGLGNILGVRTWGGEIWLTSSNDLMDEGIVTASEFGVYGPEGKEWLIEGHGVEPDIVVDNLPRATFEGRDAQLEAAVEHLERLIREDPRPVPGHPPYPDKSVEWNRADGSGEGSGEGRASDAGHADSDEGGG